MKQCRKSFSKISILWHVSVLCTAANVVSVERSVGHAWTELTHMCVVSSEPCAVVAVDQWVANMLACTLHLHACDLHVELSHAMRSQRAAICTSDAACGMSSAMYAEMMACRACMSDTGTLGGRPTAQDTDSALRRSTVLANGEETPCRKSKENFFTRIFEQTLSFGCGPSPRRVKPCSRA